MSLENSSSAAGDGESILGFAELLEILLIKRDGSDFFTSTLASFPIAKVAKDVNAPSDLSNSVGGDTAAGPLYSSKLYRIGSLAFGSTTASKSGDLSRNELGCNIVIGRSKEIAFLNQIELPSLKFCFD